MTRSRTWVAYLAGVVACAAVPALCIVAWALFSSDGPSLPPWLFGVFLIAFAIALVHAVLLGVPYTAWLRGRNRFGVLPMVIGGFVAGLAPVALISIVSSLTRGDGMALDWILRQYKDLLLFATLGATGALAFYGAFRAAQPETP